MADVLKIVLLIAGAMVVFISYWLVAEALFPSLVGRAREQYQVRPIKITLIGLAIGLPVVLLGLGLGSAPSPVAKLLSLLIISGPVLLSLVGSAGLSQRIGLGLPALTDDQQPWRRVLRGSVVLAFTFLLPVIGWFLILPWTLVSGLGAAIFALRQRPAPAGDAPPVMEATPQAG